MPALAIQIDLPLFVGAPEPAAPAEPSCARMPLEERMGRGNLGTTWRSRLPNGTAVALKRLAAPAQDLSLWLEQLQRLETLAGSTNLLEVLAVFQEDGHLWVAFRLADGVRLDQVLERRRMHPVCAVAVGTAVLDALTSLHETGVWHGAVHSRNVHVGRDGTVRVGDYGLAPEPPGASGAALRAADVRAAGALLASTLGMVLRVEAGRGRPRPLSGRPRLYSGRPVSSLGLAVRAITGSSRLLPTGREAAHARLTLWEGARGMATARRQAQAREQLAAMVAEIIEEGSSPLSPMTVRDASWLRSGD